MTDPKTDDEIIDEALDSVSHLKSDRKAAEVLNISPSSVGRYRKAREQGLPYPDLHDDTRDALLRGIRAAGFYTNLAGRGAWAAVAERPDLDPSFIHEMEILDDPDTVVRGDLHAGLGTRVYMIQSKARLHGWGREELLDALGRIRTWATAAEAEILRLHSELRRRDREGDGGGDP